MVCVIYYSFSSSRTLTHLSSLRNYLPHILSIPIVFIIIKVFGNISSSFCRTSSHTSSSLTSFFDSITSTTYHHHHHLNHGHPKQRPGLTVGGAEEEDARHEGRPGDDARGGGRKSAQVPDGSSTTRRGKFKTPKRLFLIHESPIFLFFTTSV